MLNSEFPVNREYLEGFNGQKKDDETYGEENAKNYEAMIYSERLESFLKYRFSYIGKSFNSTYCFASKSPINLVDKYLRGPEPFPFKFQNQFPSYIAQGKDKSYYYINFK